MPSSVTLVGETTRVTIVSLSRMVPVIAVVVAMLYPVPEAKVRDTVSWSSGVVSAVGSTVTVAVDEPAVKVTLVPIVL